MLAGIYRAVCSLLLTRGILAAGEGVKRQGLVVFHDLVVQNHIDQRAVHMEPSVVVYEPQFSELVHEETDPGPGRADFLGEYFLADLGKNGYRFPCLTVLGQL